VGSLTHAAPELLDSRGNTPQSDIYAFGVLMYEVISGKEPFQEWNVHDLIQAKATTPTAELLPMEPGDDPIYASFAEVLSLKPLFPPATAAMYARTHCSPHVLCHKASSLWQVLLTCAAFAAVQRRGCWWCCGWGRVFKCVPRINHPTFVRRIALLRSERLPVALGVSDPVPTGFG